MYPKKFLFEKSIDLKQGYDKARFFKKKIDSNNFKKNICENLKFKDLFKILKQATKNILKIY